MVDETSWAGVMEKLRIKNEYGQITYVFLEAPERVCSLIPSAICCCSEETVPLLEDMYALTALLITPALN